MDENTQEHVLRQYLTFKLCEEMFALDVIQVREVLDYGPAAPPKDS